MLVVRESNCGRNWHSSPRRKNSLDAENRAGVPRTGPWAHNGTMASPLWNKGPYLQHIMTRNRKRKRKLLGMPMGILWPSVVLIHCYCSISGAPGELRHVLATPFDALNLREPQLILLLNFFVCQWLCGDLSNWIARSVKLYICLRGQVHYLFLYFNRPLDYGGLM